MHDCLLQVDLGYLVERYAAENEVNWEQTLSLGETQRLAIARLLYHRPRFAILDECTSAVSGAMERRLYQLLKDEGVTYITISHRPVLKAYHDQLLTIGDPCPKNPYSGIMVALSGSVPADPTELQTALADILSIPAESLTCFPKHPDVFVVPCPSSCAMLQEGASQVRTCLQKVSCTTHSEHHPTTIFQYSTPVRGKGVFTLFNLHDCSE